MSHSRAFCRHSPSLALLALLAGWPMTAGAETITWLGGGANSFGFTANTTSLSATNPCNGQTVSAVFTDPNSAALNPYPGLDSTGTIPYMGMNATAVGQETQLELTFGGGLPVENLSFVLYDIDQLNNSGSSWTDLLTLTAFFGPTAVTLNGSCAAGSCAFTIAGSGTTTLTFLGDFNNPTFPAAFGQATTTIPGPVDRVVVNYRAVGPGTNNQFVGIGDFVFDCSTVPVTVSSFAARWSDESADDTLDVEWTTASETANVGFELVANTADGPRTLTPQMVPSHAFDSLVPQRYATRLAAEPGSLRELFLVEIDRRGRRRAHGPFEIGRAHGSSEPATAIDWGAIRREQQRTRQAQPAKAGAAAVCELGVEHDGLHRASFEDFLAGGCDLGGALTAELALSDRDAAQPIRILSDDALFGPGDTIEWLGRAGDGFYSRERVYRLRAEAASALRASERPSRAGDQPGTVYEHTAWTEEQRYYSFSSPTDDPWFADPILAYTTPVARDYPLAVDGLVDGQARLYVELWGATDLPDVAIDHHVEIVLNGVPLGELSFGGLSAQHFETALPPGLLVDGANTLTLTLPGDTGAIFDLVHLDRYGVRYPRTTRAIDDRLELSASGRETAVSGLSSPDLVVYAQEGTALRRLTRLRPEPDGDDGFRVAFRGEPGGGTRYWVSTEGALWVPRIAPARQPVGLLTGPADLLVISHSSFAGRLDRWIAARQSEGLSVKVVEVEDLYAAYAGGNFDPAAIRDYLRQAQPALGVRMVLLVGGDSYDYLDHLGIGSISFVPTFYTATHPVVRFAPSDALLADLDDDQVPDLALGRWPVRTTEELVRMIDKTLAFDPSSRQALFTADAHDGSVSFRTINQLLAGMEPASWQITDIDLDTTALADARAALLAALSDGTPLVSYFGHSSWAAWSFDNLLTAADARALPPNTAPGAAFAWGCWNGYHAVPQYDTLSHELLLRDGGVAALFGASALTETSSDLALATALLSRLFEPGATLGEAILAAQREVAQQPGRDDVVLGMTLLGDPSLRFVP